MGRSRRPLPASGRTNACTLRRLLPPRTTGANTATTSSIHPVTQGGGGAAPLVGSHDARPDCPRCDPRGTSTSPGTTGSGAADRTSGDRRRRANLNLAVSGGRRLRSWTEGVRSWHGADPWIPRRPAAPLRKSGSKDPTAALPPPREAVRDTGEPADREPALLVHRAECCALDPRPSVPPPRCPGRRIR